MDIFSDANAPFPTKVTWFESKSSRGAVTGLVEFETVEEACEVGLGYSLKRILAKFDHRKGSWLKAATTASIFKTLLNGR